MAVGKLASTADEFPPSGVIARGLALIAVLCAVPPHWSQPLLNAQKQASANHATLAIPFGRVIRIDGKISPGEWDDAASTDIEIAAEWRVRVLYKHDDQDLYFAFLNLEHGNKRRFPELLIDPRNLKGESWQPSEWWLHSSFNLCEGNGQFNVYERNGVFQCAKDEPGWSANHFPLARGDAMEVEVSFAKLGLSSADGTRFGLALDLTDTQTNWTFWPAGAQLEHPRTWGEAVLQRDRKSKKAG